MTTNRDPETFSRCGFPFSTVADRESHEDACYVCWVFRTTNQFSCLRGRECVVELGHAALVENRGDVCEYCNSEHKKSADIQHAKELSSEVRSWPEWKQNLLSDSLNPKMDEPRDPFTEGVR